MRFTTVAAITALVGAAGTSAQVASPMDLLNYVSQLLTPSCRTTLTGLVAGNSSIAQCLNVQGLYPVLMSTNGSVIPEVNSYLQSTCAMPGCSNVTIQNTTQQVLSACSTDLSNFGLPQDVLVTAMNAIPTARKVLCLSTNSTQLSNSTTIGYNSTTNSTLCPTALLDDFQSYLGVPLSTRYIQSIILGGNATAYRTITNIANNKTVAAKFACNDCVHAAVDVVLEDYPQLENATFSLGNSPLVSNLTSTNYTVSEFYQGLCGVPVGSNVSLPASINETAYGTNLTASATKVTAWASATAGTMTSSIGVASRSAQQAKKRFVRWD